MPDFAINATATALSGLFLGMAMLGYRFGMRKNAAKLDLLKAEVNELRHQTKIASADAQQLFELRVQLSHFETDRKDEVAFQVDCQLPARDSGPVKFLEIAQLLFGHKTRERVCEPVIEELREDYLLARKKCKTQGAIRWANFCFAYRAALALLGCIRAAFGISFGKFVPVAVKFWWTMR